MCWIFQRAGSRRVRVRELLGAAVALVVLQPGLAERGELVLVPAGDDVHGEAAVRQVVRGGPEFGGDARVPQTGVDGGDDLEALGGEQQGGLKPVDPRWYSAP
ncbi:hypothetical protein ADL04_17185 [Streptomyces sp. NRRL B-3648]|nr:hypothetical protein ADL04_17185 [Streptomyces sp. NRRL B-3648]